MFKETEVVLFPTKAKVTRKGQLIDHHLAKHLSLAKVSGIHFIDGFEGYDLHFLSNENIVDGEWYVNGKHLYQADRFYEKGVNDKKIIATSDDSLTIPRPDEEFMRIYEQEYNKGNEIKKVLVEYYDADSFETLNGRITKNLGIIPKRDQDDLITIKLPKDSWNTEETNGVIADYSLALSTHLLEKYKTPSILHEINEFRKKWCDENLNL